MIDQLLKIVNIVRENKGLKPLTNIKPESHLRKDFEFDSLDLAELTVRIEKETGVDIYSNGFVETVADILKEMNK